MLDPIVNVPDTVKFLIPVESLLASTVTALEASAVPSVATST